MKKLYTRGLSLVDVIVGIALLLIIFMALFGMFRASIALTAAAKARSGATSLATEQMEYVRSITYANTGTVGGIPAGLIDPEFTTILNGKEYTTRTFVQYIDDPADGLDGADVTGIITDYKKIKVDVTYDLNGTQKSVSLVSNRTPKGIETSEGGGNLRINVIDALGASVSSAQVRIQNPDTVPTVDVTTFTGSGGYVFLPGAATSTGYRITVSKSGYSSAQTYDQDAVNVSPNPGHLTVVEAATTASTFPVDILSTLRVQTWEQIASVFVEDVFFSSSNIAVASSTEVTGGDLVLTNTLGVYDTDGLAQSTSTSPTYLSAWSLFQATSTKPAGTTITYQILYDNVGTPTVLPDAVLSGNEAGFTASTIDLSGIATSTYDTLYIRANMQTNDTAVTPEIGEWRLAYDSGPVPIPNVSFTLEGSKSIGENSSGGEIKKHTINAATGPAGWNEILNIEWDGYTLATTGYDIAELCSPDDLAINPNTTNTINAYLESDSTHSLRVTVRDELQGFVEDADVSLTRTGYLGDKTTSACGQTYFGGLGNFNDYDVSVSKSGFITEILEDNVVSGDTELTVILTTS
tara:strand:- start:427913 stop:429649 length:1737 start_codon:yes stop_codon:yes gene_type:complete